jgi:TatD DNase family protein
MLIDAHVHLTDDELFELKEHVFAMLDSLDMIALSVSMDLETSKRNLSLRSKKVLPFIGIHPWTDYEDLDSFIDFTIENKDKIYGIGEIGLDKKYVKDEEGYSKQKVIFKAMLDIAEKYHKPISVHTRASLDDVLDILSSYKLSVLLHWFSGSKKQLKIANDRGYYVSFGPALLYASDKPHLLLNSNKDLVLTETDGPVRYPRCFEGRMALPSYLVSVVYAMANILNMEYDEVCIMLENNAKRYLSIDTIK